LQHIFNFATINHLTGTYFNSPMDINLDNIKEFDSLISSKEDIALIGHFNPDGDSIGTLTAMHEYLKSRKKRSTMIVPSSFPEFLRFLDPDNEILAWSEKPMETVIAIKRADFIICMDFNNLSRVEALEEPINENNAPRVLIDHHLEPEYSEFQIAFTRPDISSACEGLFYVLMAMPDICNDPAKLPGRCAECLYTGMMTDTNNYNNSIFPSTLQMASRLLETGLDKERIQSAVFDNFSESRMRLMGYMLQKKLVVLPKQHSAYMTLTEREKHEYGFREGDTEGFVNLPFAIKGVLVTAFFTESEKYIRVSLRSKCGLSVNDLSKQYFNGGGHAKAAGGRLYMPIDNAGRYFERSIKKYIESQQGTPFE